MTIFISLYDLCCWLFNIHDSLVFWASDREKHCSRDRQKWPKSDFFAHMWPISDCLMIVLTAKNGFLFKSDSGHVPMWSYIRYLMFCNVTLVWYWISSKVCITEMRQMSQFYVGGGGTCQYTQTSFLTSRNCGWTLCQWSPSHHSRGSDPASTHTFVKR